MNALRIPDLDRSVPPTEAELLDPADGAIETDDAAGYGPTYDAAMRYAAAGWYVGPVRRGSKHPGSVLGKGWQHRTSRSPETIHGWFADTDHGVFLHCGRSGAVVFDVDDPGQLPEPLRRAIDECAPPHQSTRTDVPGRGHHVFAVPDGRRMGNSAGTLGTGWGEVRGANGVIIVEPSVHERANGGGRYRWVRSGPVPVLPTALAVALPDADHTRDSASDAVVAAFRAEHTAAHSPARLDAVLERFDREVGRGGSRHDAAMRAACWITRETVDGSYPADRAVVELQRRFVDVATRGAGARTADQARAELDSVIAWGVGQALDGAKERLAVAQAFVSTLDGDQPPCTTLENRLAAVFDAADRWAERLPREIATAVWQAVKQGHRGLPMLVEQMAVLAAATLAADGEAPDESDSEITDEHRRHAAVLLDRALAGFAVGKELFTASKRAERPAPCTCGVAAATYVEPTADPVTRAAAAGIVLGEVASLRAQLLADLRLFLHLPEPAHVHVALGTAVSAVETEGPPTWLQIVAPSSIGKTETVELLVDVQVGSLGEITTAGLLSWSKTKRPVRTGLLAGITRGLVTFPDFSTLLAGSDRGGRDQVFALLRQVYDGRATRAVQSPGAGGDALLNWQGRLTIVSAVTTEIDRQLAHAQALGERWLYVRIAEPTRADQRHAARKAREVPASVRTRAAETATALVLSAQARLHEVKVPDRLHDAITDAAIVTAYGRATVPRNNYGAQDITGPATVEGVGRMVKQLTGLARGLLALDLGIDEVVALVVRVAVDSMPLRRSRVLRALAAHPDGEPGPVPVEGPVDTTGLPEDGVPAARSRASALPLAAEQGWLVSPLARHAGMDRKAVRRVMEEFAAIGLAEVTNDRDGVVDAVADGYRRWRLTPDFAEEMVAVFGPPASASRCPECP